MAIPAPEGFSERPPARACIVRDMRAIVSDQGNFESLIIGTGPDFTVVAFLELPPGSWVVFATLALAAASGVTGTSSVQTGFLLDGEIYSTLVQSDFVVADTLDGGVSGFRVVPLTTGLALDRPQTIQVGCVATEPATVSSQPTTIMAIQVESVTRIRDQYPPGLSLLEPRPLRPPRDRWHHYHAQLKAARVT